MDKLLKEDFIDYLVNHSMKSKAEAEDVWNMYGEYYLDAVYQHISDEQFHYTCLFDKGDGDG